MERNLLHENDHLFKLLKDRSELIKLKPELIYPWWRKPCKVKLLLLTDGLNFGLGDFGLSTLVSILVNDGRSYVDFEITIASRSTIVGDPGVPVFRSISEFRFNNTSHFTDSMYDQIWFFGTNGPVLSTDELKIVSAFMNNGGGVFATGDHGSLGNDLCGSITRVRSMRLWNNASGEVGMEDSRRNDTNRPGHDAGSQFDDQSDDIPQDIQPKLYSSYLGGFWKETYPHPLLCSPLGRIKVLPDHPHEGECIEPSDLSLTYIDGTPEYPVGIAPEIIAYSTVLAGSKAGTKQSTQFQTFGAICAYDGHKANVGRVVTDSTWHHFVNVNLIGELNESLRDVGQPEDDSKNREAIGASSTHGFLYSTSGQSHLAQIKHYYINIAVWLSRKNIISCFNSRWLWQILFQHRVLEATMDNPLLKFDKLTHINLYSIGSHAMDVLGKKASQCRKLQLIFDLVAPINIKFFEKIDPWFKGKKIDSKPPLPWLDHNPILAIAMGAGLIMMRDKFSNLDAASIKKVNSNDIIKVFQEGAKYGLDLAFKELNTDLKSILEFK